MRKLDSQLRKARAASRTLALLKTVEKNAALKNIAAALIKNTRQIIKANELDLKAGQRKGLGTKLDRLAFGLERIAASAQEVLKVAHLPDPVGRTLGQYTPRAKFKLERITVPLGVVGIIYESRPNVTIDATSLALKSGNAIVLRGSSDALRTNRAIVKIIRTALKSTKVPVEAVQFIDSTERKVVGQMLSARGKIDIVIPRGGRGLIDFVAANAKVPIIETGASVVHLYIDQKADLKKAIAITVNSKCRRVSICNALDTLLVHQSIAKKFIPLMTAELKKQGVKIHTTKQKFDTEFLGLELNLKVVPNLTTAIRHIQEHSLGHTEAIVTEDKSTAERFLREIDAACIYHNLSTQFSDGGEYGLGAEIGISTQKTHARGPFALEALTTYKWIGRGTGQIRK